MKTINAAALLVVTACANSGPSPGWNAQTDTLVTGIVAVTNTPAADERPTWVLEEDLRIGSVSDEGPSSFGQIKGLAVSESGRIAVLDAQAQEIRVFGADGSHLVTHGRKGGGPGEFESAFGLMTSSRGQLYVPDHQNARMSIFDMDKGFITSYPLNFLMYGFVWNGALRADDHILVPSMVLQTRQPLLRIYSPELVELDSILLPPSPPVDENDPPGAYAWRAASGTMRGYWQVPFYPNGAMAIARTGEVWSAPGGDPAYRFVRLRPPADTVLTVSTHRPLLPVMAAERDSAFQTVLDGLSQYGVKNLDKSKIPAVKPSVLSLFETDAGELWVQTSSPDSLRRYDVYSNNGVARGSAATNLQIYRWVRPVVKGDYVYAVVTDEMDVQYVVRAKIVRS